MIEELGIPDLDLIKQAQQGAGRFEGARPVLPAADPDGPVLGHDVVSCPEAAVLILTNQGGETL
jgi:hypothetical protein